MFKDITLITGNMNKVNEISAILDKFNIKVNHEKIDLDEYQSDSIEDILVRKVKDAYKYLNGKKTVMIEDTSLSFDCLGGLPGPYIKWFYSKLGNKGLYQMTKGFKDKNASAICCFALMSPNLDKPLIFEGTIRGEIVKPKGKKGFGWDQIFKPNNQTKTFAQMSDEEKNNFSHRRLALDNFISYIATHNK